MADLISLDEIKSYMGGQQELAEHDDLLQLLAGVLEDALQSETGQTFAAGGSVTDEPHDGSGTSYLYLNRPPVSLSAAIKVGQDPTSPDATIDTSYIVVDPDQWRLIYKNNCRFVRGTRNIFVSYTAAANLPDRAKMAIAEGVAYLFRRRGREHITADSLGEFGTISMLSSRMDFLPMWRKAVSHLQREAFA